MAVLDFSKAFDEVAHTRLKHKAINLDGLNHFLKIGYSVPIFLHIISY